MVVWLLDVRYALRRLRKSPGFTLAGMLMLGVGICANSTAFSWINGTLLHPIPGAYATNQLVTLNRGLGNIAPSPPLSYPDYRDLRSTNHTFSGLLAYHHEWATLTGGDTPQRIFATAASANYFDVLGIQPYLGRFFRPEEETPSGGIPHLVLGYTLWQTRFAGDPDILGKSVEINRQPFTVIGVAPPGFIGCMSGIRSDAWMPLFAHTQPAQDSHSASQRGNTWLNVTGRLKPGVTREQARQDMELLMRQLVAAFPDDHAGANTISIDPLWRSPFGVNVYLAASLPVLLAIAFVVLMLTCANVATLALVRFVSRRREIAIRQSLGAARLGLARQMALEGLLVCLGGGVLAILFTRWSAKIIGNVIPPNASPIVISGAVDARVVGTVLLLVVLAAMICGALPAWRTSRISPVEVLKQEAASLSGGGNHRLLSALVVGQVALSVALLISAGLFLRTLKNSTEADAGFNRDHVVTAAVGLGTAGYSPEEIRTFQHKIQLAIENLPGVSQSSLADWVPYNYQRKTADAYPDGYVPRLHEPTEVRRADVSPGYFATMGIPLVEGRDFTLRDNETAPGVVIVDQTAANHYWPGQEAVGKRLRVSGAWMTVVGVARNSKHQRPGESPEPMIYLSFYAYPGVETIVHVRTLGDPALLEPSLVQAIQAVDPHLTVFDVRTLREVTRLSSTFARMETGFASVFATLALILAAAGIYGVIAYRTQLRTHEIGIRVALGAGESDVLGLVMAQGIRLTVIGVALGLALSFALTRFLNSLLYGISANDPFTMISVTIVMAAVALLACYVPAFRATHIDPASAIRTQ